MKGVGLATTVEFATESLWGLRECWRPSGPRYLAIAGLRSIDVVHASHQPATASRSGPTDRMAGIIKDHLDMTGLAPPVSGLGGLNATL